MKKESFLDWIESMAVRENMKFVYTPKDVSGKRMSGVFVLENVEPETDVKIFTSLKSLRSS